jgi:hypothetical protein
MRKFLLTLYILALTVFSLYAELINDSLYISPLYTDPVQSTTVFSNPAEMAHWNNIAGLELRYRSPANSFSGTLTFKTADFLIGNFALSMEAFGSDFGSNLIWIPETTNEDAHFSLTKGGQKFTFGWAKRLDQVTVGGDFKYYRYRELDTGYDETGAGFDAGILYHPLERIYLGLVVNDLSNTEIYDQNKTRLYTVPSKLRITAAYSPLDDLSFTFGAPTDILNEDLDNRDTWKKTSFSVRKMWDKGLNLEIGYNSRDAYAALGYIISDAISLKGIMSNDLTIKDGKYQYLFVCSAVIPGRTWTSISQGVIKAKALLDGDKKKGSNPWDFLFDMWLGVNDNLITRSVYLDYADPELARRHIADMLSPDGRIGIDEKRRRLIVTDFKDRVTDIVEALHRFDEQAGQTPVPEITPSPTPMPPPGPGPRFLPRTW